jgi:hypothetical protein
LTANTSGRVRVIEPVDQQLGSPAIQSQWRNTRNRAAILADHGAVQAWSPSFVGTVTTLGVSGDQVLAGGDFTAVSGPVHRFAAFRSEGYALLSAAPGPN